MKRFLIVLAVILMIVLSASVQAQELKSAVHLRIGAAGLGSAHYVYGATFASLWRKALPKGSTIDVLAYAGGVSNAFLIDKGDAELGFMFGAAAQWAMEGKVKFPKKIKTLTGLVAQLDKYYVGIMATKKSGITSLEEVKAKKMPVRIVSQPSGGASETSMRLILDAYGMPADVIESWGGSVIPTSTGIAKAKMMDGKADIWINMVVSGHPAISELSVSTDLVFIPMSDFLINKLMKFGYQRDFLPAKTFQGQDKDVAMVGWPSILMAHKDINPELAYILTKTLVENKEALVKGHKGLSGFDVPNAWNFKQYGVPLHPGAEKYYREKGMIK